ncbi:uncharacterized protein A4U43_C10F18000 [Asparagus officinalis]|uniref:Plastid lipid-associated protein/fibrillin conserved domain-containing protein n=1 Tax=Asparagus officinalis TaxID=4686 RepID=A0A5P1E8H3_ASPOF|nr:probable plastid-lipid-associated protein 12, chloroplastic [Asparagus officinalis]XP_020248899.1 probable plastid-lipid-associated protein 12, chloroplastic [Asparagus officinalis]XP_020248900.1 probable plastid-lipid-associated protein 12, chloroplastic [Asparagus officinalis]ONK57236.1 uncharacterized protein A4U43_C10F18000 [Asparagus officinalis]
MAVGALRPSFHLPCTPKSSPFTPRIQPESLKPFRKRSFRFFATPVCSSVVEEEQSLSFTEPESALVEALLGIQGRGRAASPQQLKEVEDAVRALEEIKGVPEPTSSSLIEGRWQLIFTTRPGTASPIQRTFVGVDFFKVFQEVCLRADDQRVSNIVKFSDAVGELKVEAAARINDGKRILFQFDRAAFSFKFLPFKVPYPVPFKLLGDEAKGWLDTTYLSHAGNIRISRGNKGTTFVLQKKTDPRQRLLEAISAGSRGVTEIVEELVSLRNNEGEGYNETLEGEWQLVWVSESEDQSLQTIAAGGLEGLQVVKKNGQFENQVQLFPGFKYCAIGNISKTVDGNTYSVSVDSGYALVGGLRFPAEVKSEYTMQLLYVDNKIRIMRGDKGIIFVYLLLQKASRN